MLTSDEIRSRRHSLCDHAREEFVRTGWYHSMRFPDGRVIEGVQTLDQLEKRASEFPLPPDLSGKRVLDIGAWDGWFSFEMERRGAEVMAVDCVEIDNFRYAREQFGSRVDYREIDFFELTPNRIGRFDVVLCLGVLYHLKHPLLALERVCDLTRDVAIIESFVVDGIPEHSEFPWLEFYETDELGGGLDNWCGPTLECLLALCRTAGFARVELFSHRDQRAAVACYRRWPAEPETDKPAPVLRSVRHSQNYGINFSGSVDAYLSCWFEAVPEKLGRHDVFPEVSGYGICPIWVHHIEGSRWQVNFKLPPGLAPGWHEVRLRIPGSGYSNTQRIAVDMPPKAGELIVEGACDGTTWQSNEVAVGDSGYLSMWVRGLSENADLNNVRLYLDNRRLPLEYVSGAEDVLGRRQVNARVPGTMDAGRKSLVLTFAGERAQPVEINVTRFRPALGLTCPQ